MKLLWQDDISFLIYKFYILFIQPDGEVLGLFCKKRLHELIDATDYEKILPIKSYWVRSFSFPGSTRGAHSGEPLT